MTDAPELIDFTQFLEALEMEASYDALKYPVGFPINSYSCGYLLERYLLIDWEKYWEWKAQHG